MNTLAKARILANYITELEDFRYYSECRAPLDHMGAIICDSVLQAGINYSSVVRPRVDRLRMTYPEARTTQGFCELISCQDIKRLIDWADDVKPSRISHVTYTLLENGVDDAHSFRVWLQGSSAGDTLLAIKGIGPKTLDYLKLLVGLPAVAVDRHILKFVSSAGLADSDYRSVECIVRYAADLLSVPRMDLDYSIWIYMAERAASKRRNSQLRLFC